MKKTPQQFLTVVILTAILTACSLPSRPTSTPGIDLAQAGTIVAMTLESLNTPTPTSTLPTTNTPIPVMITPTPSPTLALTPSQTATITATYTVPMLSFDGNTNCREGPGTDYKVVIVLRAGQKVEAVGGQGSFWVVKTPKKDGTCWVASEFANASGSTWTLPTMTAPPLPTREPPIGPTWSNWKYSCAYAAGGSTLTMELAWTDHSTDETGYKVYRDGEVIVTLGPDSNSYTDITFIGSGKTLSYYIEVFSNSGHTSSSTISATCQ